jgi:hypothetical protein
MLASRLLRVRNVVALVLILILMAVVYAFAAANIVPESGAGDGSNTVSGYTVSNVHYTFQAADPSLIDFVYFDLAPTAGAAPATTVWAQLEDSVTPASWPAQCAVSATAWDFECDYSASNVPALDVDTLRVVAAQ